MERQKRDPAVEQQYEDPPPREQSLWNVGIYLTVLLVAVLFIVVILLVIYAY